MSQRLPRLGARRPGSSPARPFLILGALALGSLLGPGRAATAGLVLQVNNSTAAPGGTGSFDVVLRNDPSSDDSGSSPQTISAFSFGLAVDPDSGVTFTGADTATTSAGYIFTTYQQAGTPFAFSTDGEGNDPFPGTSFQAGDAVNDPATESITLAVGQTVGLGHVSYAVAAGTSIGTIITVSLLHDFDSFADQDSNSIVDFAEINGAIAVATPEPSSLVMCLGGSILLLGLPARRLFLRKHQKSRPCRPRE